VDAKKAVILITGGAGSLGKSIVRYLLRETDTICRVFDNSEYNIYEFERQLGDTELDKSRVRFLHGDIRDKDRLHRALVGVSEVIHTAALKHIPLCEYNPIEAVKTNILGSINVIEASLDNNVNKVLAISSDKAVHPINIYGATKLAMEKLFINANAYAGTAFSCVRLGNFSLSQGNVRQRWYKEAEEGKPLTITEKEMTRFWISISDAAEFSVKCLDMMNGGEIFIPKMEEELIIDLAKKVSPDSELRIIGKRTGEKLNEMLFAEGEKAIDMNNYFLIK